MSSRTRLQGPRALLAATVLLASCGGTPEPTDAPPAPDVEPALGWISEVAVAPGAFAALMDATSRDGWVALHANDLPAAAAAFTGDTPASHRARARVELDIAELYADLHGASQVAGARFDARTSERQLPLSAGVLAWRGVGRACPTASWSAEATGSIESPFYAERLALHRAGDPTRLREAATIPVLKEPGQGFERTLYDPCVFATLSQLWSARAKASFEASSPDAATAWADDDAGLEALLLAPWLTAAELRAVPDLDALGLASASLEHLGVQPIATSGDDVEAAREQVRALDAALDAARRPLIASAPDDGRALLTDLRLIERFRQEWLVASARVALRADHPGQALAFLELAVDVTDRVVGPANSPAVLALLANTQLRMGRTREALDALQPLTEAHPEVLGLKELVGDVAVLEGLDRHGDSKEN